MKNQWIRYKFIFFFFLICLSMTRLQAQEINVSDFSIHMKVDFSNIIWNKTQFIVVNVCPFLQYSSFYAVFDFPLFINASKGGIINNEFYTQPKNYFQFIHSIGYGRNIDPFLIKIAPITNLVFGQGTLLYHFRNDLFDPQFNQIGGVSRLQSRYIEFQIFTNQINHFNLGGVDLAFFPGHQEGSSSFASHLKIGGSFVFDTDSYGELTNTDQKKFVNYRSQNQPLFAYSGYLRSFLYDSPNISFEGSLEIGYQNLNHAMGEVAQLIVNTSHYTLELGFGASQNGYMNHLFSSLYLVPNNRQNWQQLLKGNGFIFSLCNHLHAFENLLTFHLDFYGQTQGIYSYRFSTEIKPSLLSTLSLFFGVITENGTNNSELFNITNNLNSLIFAELSYFFIDNARMLVYYKRNYKTSSTNNDQSNIIVGLKVSLFF